MKIKYENLQLPDQAGNSGKFLTTDGTITSWAVPSGGGGGMSDGDKGDITISGTGTVYTIDNNAVTLAKMAQVGTQSFLGRTSALTGNVEELTATQATAMLNTFTSSLKGLVPSGGGGTFTFLRADGTWQVPTTIPVVVWTSGTISPGSETLYLVDASAGNKSLLGMDASLGAGTKVHFKKTDSSANTVTIDPLSAQATDSTTTYVLTKQNEAVTFISDGTGWKVLSSNVVSVNNIAATGTPSNTTFLRGDGTWSTPAGGSSQARVVALTDGTTIAVNADTTDVGTVTIAGNRTISNPSGTPVDGQRIEIRVKQDATGGRTLSWGTSYRFGTDIPSTTLSPTASKTDYILFIYNGTDAKWDCRSILRGY